MADKKDIKTPPQRKLVGIDNKPLAFASPPPAIEHAPDTPAGTAAKIIAGLRDMADKMEDGTLKMPEFVMVMPKFIDGDIPMYVLGESMPIVLLEGILHKVLVRMAMS